MADAVPVQTSAPPSNIIEGIQRILEGRVTGNDLLDFKLIGDFTVSNLIALLIIIAAVVIVYKIVSILLRRGLSGKVEPKNIDNLIRLVFWIILFIGFLVASPQLHIDLSGLLVAGGVVGVALGFASQNTLSNFIAGILLMIERPIGLGEVVVISGIEGYVEGISLLSTRIKTYDGVVLRIPNTTVFSANITNCVSNVARRISYTVEIGYSEDADAAVKIIRDTVDKHPYILSEPAPTIYVDDLGDSGIKIVAYLWTPSKYWWDAKIALLWEIYKALRDANVDIPFNQLTIWYGKEDAEKLRENIDSGKSAAEILGKKKEPVVIERA